MTNVDEGKIRRYGDIGVRELWRIHASRGSEEIDADFLALDAGRPPRSLITSEVIEGLQPADVCEAVEGVRLGLTRDERTEAVASIVRRRKRNIFRVRDEPPGEDQEAAGGHPARSPRRPG